MINITKVRNDFPMLSSKMQGQDLIYFDNGATTFKPNSVIDTVVNYYKNMGANCHRGDYDLSHEVDVAYEACRKAIAKFLNAEYKEIVFTSGASASLNLVANGYGRKILKPGDVVLSCESEHASSVLPWMKCCEETGAKIEFVEMDDEGRITLDNYKKALHANVKVVALAHVSNVLGYINPMKEMVRLAHEIGAVVSVDAAQSAPHIAIDVKDMDCDFLSFSAHKMCGPTGVGVLYGKYELLNQTEPVALGGGSNARFDNQCHLILKEVPYKFETGTPMIEAVLGMHAAIDYLTNLGLDHIHEYEVQLRNYAVNQLKELNNIEIYNPNADSGIITMNVKGVFAQDAASYFNANGIAVRAGHHCAKMLAEKLGTPATLRISLYFYNTVEEVDKFVEVCRNATIENCLNVFF